MAAKNGGDAGLGDDDAELLELAHDSQVAPAWVLPCQANDQLDRLMGQGRAAGASVGIGPSSSNEGTMPAKDRLGRDEEGCPSLTRDEASEDADDRSIRPGEAGTGDLTLSTVSWWRSTRISASLATASIRWMRIASMTRRTKR